METRYIEKYGICESCENFHVQWILKDTYKNIEYKICGNCLIFLVGHKLSKENYNNLIKNGHKENEFLLHGDFYIDEEYYQESF